MGHRHGFCDWDSVAAEVRTRPPLPVFVSADDCRQRYRDLQRRFKDSADDEAAEDIPWLEELRSLRVAELRRELKVKKLEEEEERDGGEKLDLEEEKKGERSEENDKAEESDRENRSMNESNSTATGEKTDEPSKIDPDPVNTAGKDRRRVSQAS
ncbi:hypothetical protein Bca52824_008816 [Brassica carinata]|uniref:Uncharacterized protein n=1 Tax=Brassica carinata TaxID=52824 RepID=A0A8X7W8Q5_BRACI|nr:hypothetical protein Bca52824_008816 [Brassica carinata]